MNMGAEQISKLADFLPGAVFHYEIRPDGQESIRFLNAGCEQIWKVTEAEIAGDASLLWNMIHDDDLDSMKTSVARSAEELSAWEHAFRIVDAQGTRTHVLGRGVPERTADGGVAWLTFLFDVTHQSRTQELFETVTQQLDFVSKAIPDAFALFDPHERLIVCNEKFQQYYGLGPLSALHGLSYPEILANAARQGNFPAANCKQDDWIAAAVSCFRDATGCYEEQKRDTRWFKALDRPTGDGGRVSFRIEITTAKVRSTELEKAASTDSLTGLANRRGLSNWLCRHASNPEPGAHIAILHIDLDKFKAINDVQGHDAGDEVLCQTADRLTRQVGSDGLAARVGGDEFALVFPSREDVHHIQKRADQIRADITQPIATGVGVCQVGASIGLSIWSECLGMDVEQSLLDADTALLASKNKGRNQCSVFSTEMRKDAVARAELAARIKTGVEAGEFLPFFQPQFEMPGRSVVGVETLARWRQPDGAFLNAGSFIDVASETGQIAAIDSAMLDGTLQLLRCLGKGTAHLPRASINLSSLQLQDKGIVEKLQDKLFEYGLSPSQLNVEVLESTLLDQRSEIIAQNIRTLANAGFRIELDDFGTGHTALVSLTSFPVHLIKIDRSLVTEIHKHPAKRAITEGIFSLCDRLSISAIAEGVETEEELAELRSIGFTMFQGFLFAKPMDADAILRFVTDQSGALRAM